LITDAEDFLIKVKNFAENLKKSCATSIDFYTTRIADKKMQIVAKSLIGGVLNQYKTDLNSSWYGDLLPLFFPEDIGFKKPEEKLEMIIELTKKIRIVTFNYDLSLEKFLYEFLKNNVFVSGEEEQLETAKRIIFETINHVYGSIDDPFNCDFDLIKGDNFLGRGRFLNNNEILKDAFINQEKYSTNINLIENERLDAKCKLIKCAYLYVLGFGFDPINIERIGMNPEIWGRYVADKNYGYGCFVTNFDDNKKVERLLLNNLVERSVQYYSVPIISKLSVKEALKKDFSLIEIAKNAEHISRVNERASPFFALKNYQ
jgi:hypothetical protein